MRCQPIFINQLSRLLYNRTTQVDVWSRRIINTFGYQFHPNLSNPLVFGHPIKGDGEKTLGGKSPKSSPFFSLHLSWARGYQPTVRWLLFSD
ncbi:hypothetical protein BGS_1197 [Beggiatoa sp. SS]|nr:hypothetical protein BGS_1197 [Beggiatoa sp. SS]